MHKYFNKLVMIKLHLLIYMTNNELVVGLKLILVYGKNSIVRSESTLYFTCIPANYTINKIIFT